MNPGGGRVVFGCPTFRHRVVGKLKKREGCERSEHSASLYKKDKLYGTRFGRQNLGCLGRAEEKIEHGGLDNWFVKLLTVWPQNLGTFHSMVKVSNSKFMERSHQITKTMGGRGKIVHLQIFCGIHNIKFSCSHCRGSLLQSSSSNEISWNLILGY